MLTLTGLRIYEIICHFNKNIKKSIPFVFLSIVIIFSLIPNYPLVTGDFNGNLKTVDLPQDYKNTISFLNSNKEDNKSIWGVPYTGLKSSWHINNVGKLTDDISPLSTFNNPTFNDNFNYPVLFGI